jgi:hypothetical protein
MTTLTRRERIFIIVGLILITAVLYLVYFLLPSLNRFGEDGRRLLEAQSQLGTLRYQAAGVQKLDGEIGELNEQLGTQWACVPVGIDHARILLYLKELTDGRAENVGIAAPNPAEPDGSFLRQTFTVDFQTSYANLLSILGDLKKNGLYSRVTLMTADYRPEEAAAAGGADEPIFSKKSNYVIAVHLELSFLSLAPSGGEEPAPAMTPTNAQRHESLMPAE